MDLASLIKSEMSKAKFKGPSALGASKYVKKADVEAQREQAYSDDQRAQALEKERKLDRKRQLEEEDAERRKENEDKRRRLANISKQRREESEAREEAARRQRLGLSTKKTIDESLESTDSVKADLPEDELCAKLRDLQEPVILFGETDAERQTRLRSLLAAQEAAILNKIYPGPIPTILEPVEEKDMRVSTSLPEAGSESRKHLYRQLTSYFNLVFKAWKISLQDREPSVKESSQGRIAESAMLSTLDSLKPLFQKFETGTIEDSIITPLLSIVCAAQERRYVDANNEYLRLSIGKAAWPIGVTMVGIHERSAREKLHESDAGKAHIMSDEITRKFLQGIKRCLSYAQTRWPPEDFSQMMG